MQSFFQSFLFQCKSGYCSITIIKTYIDFRFTERKKVILRVVLLWVVFLQAMPIYAMGQPDSEHSICYICHNALIPVEREELAALFASWAEYPDLCKKLTKITTALQRNPELQARLSELTWDQVACMQAFNHVITDEELRPAFEEVRDMARQLVVEKLLCHDSLIPQFHRGCLKKTVRTSLNCPTCRTPFSQEVLKQLGLSFEQVSQDVSVNMYEQNRAWDYFEPSSESSSPSKNVCVLTTIVLLGICYFAIEFGLWPHWVGMVIVSSFFGCIFFGGLYGILQRQAIQNYSTIHQTESDEEDEYFDA
jgi:hypothetical protein